MSQNKAIEKKYTADYCDNLKRHSTQGHSVLVRTSGGTYDELLLNPTASMPMTHEASRSMSFHWAPGRDEVVEEEGGREWKLRHGGGGGGGGGGG